MEVYAKPLNSFITIYTFNNTRKSSPSEILDCFIFGHRWLVEHFNSSENYTNYNSASVAVPLVGNFLILYWVILIDVIFYCRGAS